MFCPSSASAKDCTALFTVLPWEAHSWLITLELAVQHECSRREKPDECLNGAPVWMPCLIFSLSSISCFSISYFYLNLFFCAFPNSMCRELNQSLVCDLCVFKMTWVKSESCWKGSCLFVQVSLGSNWFYCNTVSRWIQWKHSTDSEACLSHQ